MDYVKAIRKLFTVATFLALVIGLGFGSAVPAQASSTTGTHVTVGTAATVDDPGASINACGTWYNGNEVYYTHCGSTYITIYIDHDFAYSYLDRYMCIAPWQTRWIGFRSQGAWGGYLYVGC
jgi:hypothetical protein